MRKAVDGTYVYNYRESKKSKVDNGNTLRILKNESSEFQGYELCGRYGI